MDEVIFKTLKKYPGYKFGSDGSIWSCNTRQGLREDKWKPLVGSVDKDGYRQLIICANQTRYSKKFHSLILEAFVGPRPNGMVACHNDGNVLNNSIDNLRWDTQYNNLQDKKKHGTYQIGDKSTRRILTESQVLEIRRRHKNGEYYRDLAQEFGVKSVTIHAVISGRNWRHLQ